MLIEFSVENYRSIKDRQTLSLVAGSNEELPDNCIETGKLKLLKTVGIYGANASGKSNLLKALDSMLSIITKSAGNKPLDELRHNPFLLDKEAIHKPSEFEIIFNKDETRYQYGFSFTEERIHNEWLYYTPEKQARKLFDRAYNPETDETKFSYGVDYKGDRKRLEETTTINSLFLSTASQWNHEQLTEVYSELIIKIRILPPSDSIKPVTAKMLIDRVGDYNKRISSFLVKADLGIKGIGVLPEMNQGTQIPEEITDEEQDEFLRELEENEHKYRIALIHVNEEDGVEMVLPLASESDGTQRLFEILGPILQTIDQGFTVFVDELERSLHPLICRALIEFIQNPETNRRGAQLVFATHDTTLLSPSLLRRDQIWFTEKDNCGATHLIPLSDYKVRKEEALQKGYLAGRYGAVPILEEFKLE